MPASVGATAGLQHVLLHARVPVLGCTACYIRTEVKIVT